MYWSSKRCAIDKVGEDGCCAEENSPVCRAKGYKLCCLRCIELETCHDRCWHIIKKGEK